MPQCSCHVFGEEWSAGELEQNFTAKSGNSNGWHTKRIQKKYNSWYSAIWPAGERHQIICACFTRWIVFVDKAHWISHAAAENGIAIATIGRRKTDCEDVAMAWKPGVSWDDWDTLWEGVPILKGWSLQCNGKSFVLWSELSTDGTKWGWMARNMNSVHHIDLSSHRVSWFFLHMASWIKMSGNFYVSVASLVAFITLFCSISQRYM